MQQPKRNKFDLLETGLLAGFLLPVLVFFVVYLGKESQVSFFEYVRGMWRMQALIKLGSLCVFTNVAVFWIFLKMKYEKAARGVLGVTILYAVIILILRAV
jgi:hypothetical protein